MPIRLLALDLDGTLLNSRGEITSRTRETLAKARTRGVKVALVTGRRFRDARPLAVELGVDVPVIAHNGALTKHAQTLELVGMMPLPVSAAREVLRIGRQMNADLLVSDECNGQGIMVYDHLNGDNPALLRYVEWAKRVHGDDDQNGVLEVASLEEYLDHNPIHVAYRELAGEVKIFRTAYPQMDFMLLDLVHPEASKGVGVSLAAQELGISSRDVLAIGDNFNDLEMLRFAGIAVVMGNADPELRQLPNFYTTASNDDDGVAQAIERFILQAKETL